MRHDTALACLPVRTHLARTNPVPSPLLRMPTHKTTGDHTMTADTELGKALHERDRARDIAVTLEQELAAAEAAITRVQDLARTWQTSHVLGASDTAQVTARTFASSVLAALGGEL